LGNARAERVTVVMKGLAKLLHMRHNTPDGTTETNSQGYAMDNEIDTKQAADKYKVSETYIRRMIREGRIKGHKLRRDWLVDANSLDQFMTSGRKWVKKRK